MDCKHCGAPLNEEDQICTECGTAAEELQDTAAEMTEAVSEETEVLAEETAETEEPADETAETDEPADETAETEEPTEEAEEEEPVKEPAPKKNTGLIIALVACVAAIIVLLVMLFTGGKDQPADNEPPIIPPENQTLETPVDTQPAEGEIVQPEAVGGTETVTPFVPAVSYMNDDPAAFDEAMLAAVVASCGDSELTNEMLTYYYWREYFTFMNMYSSYITMMMDPYGRLDEQESVMGGESWDEMFMNYALTSYHTYAAAATAGREAGYEITESEREGLDNIDAELQSYAELYGYETADAYLQLSFGPYATAESYKAFMEEYIYGASYLEHLLQAEEITAADIDAYYEDHKEDLIAAGLEKDDRPMVNIRHILIMPEEVTIAEGEEGYEEAKAAALAAAETTASEIYAQWQAGTMDEDSFAALAMEHSQDGSAPNGGLIENIRPGQTVENFDAWCFTEGRVAGDHGMVETQFGCHIVFLSAVQEESYWYQSVKTEYENDLYMEICRSVSAQYPLTSDLSKAAVYPVNTEIMNSAQ